jgi:alcohol dehydrogenase
MDLPGFYEFYCGANIVSGHHALERIPAILARMKAHKVFIVTDKNIAAAGLLDIVLQTIRPDAAVGGVFDAVPVDSDVRVVHHIAAQYRHNGCQALIAVGGGSVLDSAKGANIVVSENANQLMDFSGAGKLKARLRPLISIPTTAGTGSEVTLVAVIADREKRAKMLFTSPFLLPDAAILDSRMTVSLPPAVTAATGMDALAHAVEAYTCLAKNPLSDAYAVTAIRLIRENLVRVVGHPDDRDGRLAMAQAACLAGMAFSNSMVGMVHSIGHSVGALCYVPHGVCMAILLPYGLEYNRSKNGEFTAELLFPLAGEKVFIQTPKHKRAATAIAYIRELNQQLHAATSGKHPRNFKETVNSQGHQLVPKEKFAAIARNALNDGSIFYNPEELDYEDMLRVLEAAWEGRTLADL